MTFNICETIEMPAYVTLEDVRYFQDKVKLNPNDEKSRSQLEAIEKKFLEQSVISSV